MTFIVKQGDHMHALFMDKTSLSAAEESQTF